MLSVNLYSIRSWPAFKFQTMPSDDSCIKIQTNSEQLIKVTMNDRDEQP